MLYPSMKTKGLTVLYEKSMGNIMYAKTVCIHSWILNIVSQSMMRCL